MTETQQVLEEVRVDLDEAVRVFSEKKYEQAAELLGDSLEVLRAEFGEEAPELAPILHQYGKALLENAIASSNVLGGGGTTTEQEEEEYEPVGVQKDDARFSFGGDGEEESTPSSQTPFKRKASEGDSSQMNGNEEENEEDDDMGVAFTVLDFARVLYERILEGSGSSTIGSSKGKGAAVAELKLITGETWDKDAIAMDLAEVRNDLGDVGLETENFEQASEDYRAALELLQPHLPPYSRRLSDAHLRLGLALEFHPDVSQRESSSEHIQQAATVLQRRLVELERVSEQSSDGAERDSLFNMDSDQLSREAKDVKEMLLDLETKLEEMKANPITALKENGKPVNQVLEDALKDAFLGAATSSMAGKAGPKSDQPVNDLSARVKRKKQQ
ncbi:hypothetical protein MEQU1_001739 [Malassezia equina]|uniref:Tetratricopeptide SHNi-TPR domain-containing protein n=1 Tax=Malassezia equina TaxID=1381935 RepID=A0AAF0ECG2_9BASI|nr:hypothetical protein MEQU1_001739 [Malassezia equina]